MSKSRWLLAALICSLVATPAISNAQASDSTKGQIADSTKDDAKDFVHDVLRGLLGPHRNVFVQGGFTRGDRFVLQQAANTIDGERSLQGSTDTMSASEWAWTSFSARDFAQLTPSPRAT